MRYANNEKYYLQKVGFMLIIVLISLTSGCYKKVYVPVPTCPTVEIPKRELLQSKQLPKDADTDSILKAVLYDITYLTNYADQLTTILNGYSVQVLPVQPNGKVPK